MLKRLSLKMISFVSIQQASRLDSFFFSNVGELDDYAQLKKVTNVILELIHGQAFVEKELREKRKVDAPARDIEELKSKKVIIQKLQETQKNF